MNLLTKPKRLLNLVKRRYLAITSSFIIHSRLKTRLSASLGLLHSVAYLPVVVSWDKYLLNPRTYTQIHTPTVVQGWEGGGGWIEPRPSF